MNNLRTRKKGSLFGLLVVLFIALIGGGILLTIGSGIIGGVYSVVKAKTVEGTVESIENLTPNMVAAEGGITYSFAVSLETEDEIFNFSAEDRQWATVKAGDRIKAKAFPYAPWQFDKAGTYHGGRLLKKYKK